MICLPNQSFYSGMVGTLPHVAAAERVPLSRDRR